MVASGSRVADRGSKLLLASLLLALAAPAAFAQVASPRLVGEGDEAAEDEPQRIEEVPAPRAAARGEAEHAPAVPSRRAPAAAPAAPAPAAPASATAAPAGHPASARLPPPPPPPTAAPDLARRIVPVSTSWEKLMAHWTERRVALREADPARADAAAKAVLAARRELGIENLVPLAAAEVRLSGRAAASNLPAAAVAHAQLAVELAPSLADAHVALARARLAQEPGRPVPALRALADALAAAVREPHTSRAFVGDVLAALLAALVLAACTVIVLFVARRVRLFLHDFHHLPLLRGTAPVQASFLALALLAVPIVFGLGLFATLGVGTLAVWLYLGTRERLVATVALAVLLAAPWGAGAAARLTAWTGTLAERVHELEHGGVSDAEAAELGRLAAAGPAPVALQAALGRHHKRRGDLEEGLRWYRQAAAADPRAPELQVNLANVLFLKGDLEAAKAAYLAATDRAGADLVSLGAANYGLSKLYLRTSDMAKSAAAREKAESQAGAFLRQRGSDDEFAANLYLVDVPVPSAKVLALANGEASAAALRAWASAGIAGALPRDAWPWMGAGLVAALWLLALVAGRLSPSVPCDKCGGPACRRCDGGATQLCGQCVNVFLRKGVVDPRDRTRKEAQVRRHARLSAIATRVLAVAGGGAGHVWNGAAVAGSLVLVALLFLGFVVVFWRGVLPPPHPSPHVLFGKLAFAAPAALVVWGLAVRDAFRRTR